jgi:LmbE family N-acetylglucosaminyl deacetylase
MGEREHLVVFSPHHDDAYWKVGGLSLHLKEKGWKVTFVTVIGDHYQWGGGREPYRRKAEAAARNFGVEHVLLDFKSMEVQGPDARMAETFCELVRDLEPTIAVTEYPHAIHPDHQGVAVNSLRALLRDWYGVPRKMPPEVWCYYGYAEYPLYDIAVDTAPWHAKLDEALLYWNEFGEGRERNTLWRSKADQGYVERFFLAKPDSRRFTRLFDVIPDKLSFHEHRMTANIIF